MSILWRGSDWASTERAKYECYRCNKEWRVCRGSILECLKIPFTKFFNDNQTVRARYFRQRISKTNGTRLQYRLLSIPGPVLLSFFPIQISDLFPVRSRSMSPISVGEEKTNRGRGAAGKVPVSGILEHGRKVTIEDVPYVKGDTLPGLAMKKVRRESLNCTD
jgi:hypothetical protein